MLELLIRTRAYIGLKALIEMEPGQREKDRFETLMTLRFGEAYARVTQTWKSWLKDHLDEATHRNQAVSFWKEHPYSIPTLLTESIAHLEIPEALNARMLSEIGEVGLVELLESRRAIMTDEEIRLIESAQSVPPIGLAEETAVVPLTEGIPPGIDETMYTEVPEDGAADKSIGSTIATGAVETTINYTTGGDLLTSAISTALDKGSEVADEHLTVTIIEDEEERGVAENRPQASILRLPGRSHLLNLS